MEGKILVVDDEEAPRRSLAEILRLEGCQVLSAADGEEAIKLIRRESFDLILLDLKMPGMDGLEVLRLATQITPETQIVLLTAHGSLESAIEALRYGAHDYLLKPSSPAQIIHSVESGLARRAELQRKRGLLEQLESSVQLLRGIEITEASALVDPEVIRLDNGVMLDLSRREVWLDNRKVILTPTECKLLKVLLENRNWVFTHRELVLMVQGYETSDWEAPEVLRPLVSRLRHKLSVFPEGDKWIVNVRGKGYVFEHARGEK
jgi:DNA-binding response OmpR family regulator